MSLFASNRQTLLIATLVVLSLRALTPDGYMPGSERSGLLYELCPDGMPAEIMQALASDQHHHHHGGEDGASVTGTEQCPIGHMLASAVAVDMGVQPDLVPDTAAFEEAPATLLIRVSTTAYRSRAPPA